MPDSATPSLDVAVVTNLAFEAWPCYEFVGITTKSFLKKDVDVRCGSSEHQAILKVAMAGLVLYAGGLILLNAVLLWVTRHAIVNEKPTELSNAIRFLHKECKSDAPLTPHKLLTGHQT